MLVVFVGRNLPSPRNIEDPKARRWGRWIFYLVKPIDQTMNLNLETWQLQNLDSVFFSLPKDAAIIAVGAAAEKALVRAGREHYAIPHPGIRSMLHINAMESYLAPCKEWLNCVRRTLYASVPR